MLQREVQARGIILSLWSVYILGLLCIICTVNLDIMVLSAITVQCVFGFPACESKPGIVNSFLSHCTGLVDTKRLHKLMCLKCVSVYK